RVMKLMCSGVTSSAATTRSPSFSRSSSSTTITNLPAAKSEIASGTVASPMRYLILLAEVADDVAGHDVRLEVDHTAGAVASRDRDLEGVRDQGYFEGAGRLVHRGHGEADAVHRDRAFDGHESGDRGGQLESDFLAGGGGCHRPDGRGRVHMSLDQVAVEQRAGADGKLQVDLCACSHAADGTGSLGAANHLGRDVRVDLVDQPRGKKCGVSLTAAFDKQAQDASLSQLIEQRLYRHAPVWQWRQPEHLGVIDVAA